MKWPPILLRSETTTVWANKLSVFSLFWTPKASMQDTAGSNLKKLSSRPSRWHWLHFWAHYNNKKGFATNLETVATHIFSYVYWQFFSIICQQFWPIFGASPTTIGRRRLWTATNFDPKSSQQTVVETRFERQTKAQMIAVQSRRSEIWQSKPLLCIHAINSTAKTNKHTILLSKIFLIADFKPEIKNLMLSLVLFTLFPSLERFQQLWRCQGPWQQWNEAAEDHSNHPTNKQTKKKADFKPEPKNLMLSLVLFTLFPSLERHQRQRQWRQRQRGDDENKDKAAEDHSNKQKNKLTSNLNLKTLCFPLCFSHSSHLWNDVNDGGGGGGAATMKTTTKLLKTYCSAHFLRLKRIFCVAMNRVE